MNEEGTKAAAATAIGFVTYSLMRTPEFKADHSFAFMLVTNNAQILFNGLFEG